MARDRRAHSASPDDAPEAQVGAPRAAGPVDPLQVASEGLEEVEDDAAAHPRPAVMTSGSGDVTDPIALLSLAIEDGDAIEEGAPQRRRLLGRLARNREVHGGPSRQTTTSQDAASTVDVTAPIPSTEPEASGGDAGPVDEPRVTTLAEDFAGQPWTTGEWPAVTELTAGDLHDATDVEPGTLADSASTVDPAVRRSRGRRRLGRGARRSEEPEAMVEATVEEPEEPSVEQPIPAADAEPAEFLGSYLHLPAEATAGSTPDHDVAIEHVVDDERWDVERDGGGSPTAFLSSFLDPDAGAAETAEHERLAAESAERRRLEQERDEAETAERTRLAAQRAEDEQARTAAEEAERHRLEALREAAQREEAERLAALKAEEEIRAAEQAALERAEAERDRARRVALHAEQARLAAEAAEAERIEAERAAAQQAETERLEAARIAAAEAEQTRLAAEAAEAQRIEAERAAAQQAEDERLEGIRLEAERAAYALAEQGRIEAIRVAAVHVEAERLATLRIDEARQAAERAEAARLAVERAEAERREAERLEAERARLDAEMAERQRLAAEQAEADRLAAERAAAEQAEAARLAQVRADEERLAAELAAAAQAEQERQVREQAEADRIALLEQRRQEALREQERLAQERAEAEQREAEERERRRQAALLEQQERIAAQRAEKERIAAERAEWERQARERAARAAAPQAPGRAAPVADPTPPSPTSTTPATPAAHDTTPARARTTGKPAGTEPIPRFVEFRPGNALNYVFGALFTVFAGGAVIAIFWAVSEGTRDSILGAAALTSLAMVSWWALLSWSPPIVSISNGLLELSQGHRNLAWDLRDPATEVTFRGRPSGRSWKAVLRTDGGKTVRISARQVDPVQFTEIVEHYQAAGPEPTEG